MTEILAFLALFNLHYPDNTVITPSNATFFLAGDIPVIYLAPHMNKPNVILHEACHAAQYARAGNKPAQTWKEWESREIECAKIERIYLDLTE
jgi:hypothetical protein